MEVSFAGSHTVSTSYAIRFFLPAFRMLNHEKIMSRFLICAKIKLSANGFVKCQCFGGWSRYIEVVA